MNCTKEEQDIEWRFYVFAHKFRDIPAMSLIKISCYPVRVYQVI